MEPRRACRREGGRSRNRIAALDGHVLPAALFEANDASFEDVDRRKDGECCANTLAC